MPRSNVMTRVHKELFDEVRKLQEELKTQEGLDLSFPKATQVLTNRYRRWKTNPWNKELRIK